MMCWRAGVSGHTSYPELRSIMLSWPLHARLRHLFGRGPVAPPSEAPASSHAVGQPEAALPVRLK
jgi:hypothetical protein